ncbi:hypothetical protein RJT34_08459 [Clitoria ternatea]|uniref:Transmembrane protein n=1 Tax=Clitoria ternatea TaxID=43366 RepID=A0AAN9K6C4_CLITE
MLVSHSLAPCGAIFTPKFIITSTKSPLLLWSQSPKTTRPLYLTLAKAEPNVESTNSSASNDQMVFVGDDDVPLEGVIQFDKPTSSPPFQKWGRVALLAGGDVLALLLFATVGRYSHGLSVFDVETLRTADPFIAGWFLGAYFLGGFGEDGRGMKGLSKGVIATAKSWALGIPIGIVIRAATSGHLPNYGFVFVSLGSTAVLLITLRALLYSILPVDNSKKSDVYRRGSPFELFELLTSLVRRW